MTAELRRQRATMTMTLLPLLAKTQTGRHCCTLVVAVAVAPSLAEQQTTGLYDLHNRQ